MTDSVKIFRKDQLLYLPVRVQACSSHTQIVGFFNGILKIRLTAPPAAGRANRQLLEFLRQTLKLPARSLALVRGPRSRNKMIAVKGLSQTELMERIAGYLV